MALPEKIEQLVVELTKLTGSGKVNWQETASAATYLAPIGKFSVAIAKEGSEVYGGYNIQILDKGKVIDGALATYGTPTSEIRQNWERLRDLHELARRSALHADQAVSDLLSSLQQIR